jgi:hypothetical protein
VLTPVVSSFIAFEIAFEMKFYIFQGPMFLQTIKKNLLNTLAGFKPGASDPEAYAMPMSRIYLTHSDLVFWYGTN